MTGGNSILPQTLNLTSLCNDGAIFEAYPNSFVENRECSITFDLSANSSSNEHINYKFTPSSNVFRVPLDKAPTSNTLYSVVLKCLLDNTGTYQYQKNAEKLVGM